MIIGPKEHLILFELETEKHRERIMGCGAQMRSLRRKGLICPTGMGQPHTLATDLTEKGGIVCGLLRKYAKEIHQKRVYLEAENDRI